MVQVLDIEDLSSSRWSQIEAIEARERGEMTKGREVVRIAEEDGTSISSSDTATGGASAGGMHKLLLCDAAGTRVYGFELSSVPGIGLGMGIGAKILLKDVGVARGVVLLEGRTVEVLGGKVEALQRIWSVGRKERLRAAVQGPGAGEEYIMDVG